MRKEAGFTLIELLESDNSKK
ncbi:MAG: type II secretion system protein [Planctomycetes bacterium]|nr:type II secretion system protein [Planctomycetota bacterium]